jgi:hypothetical protein
MFAENFDELFADRRNFLDRPATPMESFKPLVRPHYLGKGHVVERIYEKKW